MVHIKNGDGSGGGIGGGTRLDAGRYCVYHKKGADKQTNCYRLNLTSPHLT